MSKTYAEKLRDPRWQKMRLRIMERDGFACIRCFNKEVTLNVHHCFYQKGDPWQTGADFLMTLCEKCHKDRQAVENSIRENIGRLFAKCGQEELDLFLEGLEKVIASDDTEYPVVLDSLEVEYLSDIRWYRAAGEIKSSRKAYESVVGRKQNWTYYDKEK